MIPATDDDLDAVDEALTAHDEVSVTRLVPLITAGCRTGTLTTPVTTGRVKVCEPPRTDPDWGQAARTVSHIMVRLIRERDLMIDWRGGGEWWHPVPVSGGDGGYGLAAEDCSYRLSRDWDAQMCGEYWGYRSRVDTSWRARVAEGAAPPPMAGFDPVTGRKRWDPAAVRAAKRALPGRGARTDLRPSRPCPAAGYHEA